MAKTSRKRGEKAYNVGEEAPITGTGGGEDERLYDLLDALESVRKGDLTIKLRAGPGVYGELATSFNTMVDNLNAFSSEVTRVSREVGTEGKLGGQAKVEGVGGTWKELTDNVNVMAANLTSQVRNIAKVTTAVAKGDLSQKITVEAQGEILQLKETLNAMVDNLNAFSSEVTRVSREVGTEGKLGGQAKVEGVSGTWKELTDNVNIMAANLTTQVRNIAQVTTAVANGDLSQKITVEAQGEILQLKGTINQMVDNLDTFAGEVTRVAGEVGTEGKLGGQAKVEGVGGTWKELTDNVNTLAGNLTNQVRNIAKVTIAVAEGDLSQKITVEAQGEIAQLKDTINQMVDNLDTFAGEVTRVSREVGTEGKLGGQAKVEGVSGTWKELTDNVNIMAANLTTQVRNIAQVTTAVANGDLSQKITVEAQGEILQLKGTINQMVDNLDTFAGEVTRVAGEVGTEGKLGGQAKVEGVSGTWKELTDNVNTLAANLSNQIRGIAQVVTAISAGDLTQKITVEAKGEIGELADITNKMVDDLNRLAGEVSRVARVAGEEGKLTERATVEGVSGSWKDITDTLNRLIESVAKPVLEVRRIMMAVSKGDLTQKVAIETRGDIKVLADTINKTVDDLVVVIGRAGGVSKRVVVASTQVAASSRQVNAALRQTSSIVNQVAKGAQEQSKKMEETTKVVSNLSNSIQQGAINARSTAETGIQVTDLATRGAESGKIATEKLKLIEDMTQSNVDIVRIVDERAQEVIGITTDIKDITDQTNLLALNAAVEAARAGEAGKGFAVVAGEIRRLAEGAKQSTVKVGGLVGAVRKSASESFKSLSEGAGQVAESTKTVNQALGILDQIISGTQDMGTKVQVISEATQQQSSSAQQVAQSVDAVASIAEQSASGARQMSASVQQQVSAIQQVASSAQEMAGMSKDLKDALAKFKLPEGVGEVADVKKTKRELKEVVVE